MMYMYHRRYTFIKTFLLVNIGVDPLLYYPSYTPLHNEIQQYSISKAISSLQYAPKLNSPTPHNRKLTRQLHSNSIYFIQNGPVIHLPQSNTFVLHLIIFYSSLEKIIMIPNPRDQI